MYTICFDESSGFEEFDYNPHVPVILAGVIYNDKRENEGFSNCRELERERLIEYFKKICEDAGVSFPSKLHVAFNNESKLKTPFLATLREFLEYGTYNGKELLFAEDKKPLKRKGSYQIGVILKTKIGGELTENAVFKDGEASNSYLNMASSFIKNGIFLNLEINEKKPAVKFDFPTRIMPYSKAVSKEYAGKYKQIYLKDKRLAGKVMDEKDRYYISRADQFSNDIKPIEVVGDVFPKKIEYDIEMDDYSPYAFYYLADIITGYLKCEIFKYVTSNSRKKTSALLRILDEARIVPTEDAILLLNARKKITESAMQFKNVDASFIPSTRNCKDPVICEILKNMKNTLTSMKNEQTNETDRLESGVALLELADRANYLNPNCVNIIFCYDTIDYQKENTIKSFREDDIYEVYSQIYDALLAPGLSSDNSDQVIRDFYKETVFDRIDRQVMEEINRSKLQKLIDRLIEDRYSNNLKARKFLYMYEQAERGREALEEKGGSLTNKYSFRLYDVGISAYTHTGNTSSAIGCYDKCMKIDGVSSEERKLAKNRLITIYNDLLEYKKAEEIGFEILNIRKKEPSDKNILDRLKKAVSGAFSGGKKDNSPLARLDLKDPVIYKAASSIGQTYSFLLNPMAEDFFSEVLKYRRDQDDADFYITASFCLHWYIENKEREKYEKLAEEYYGGYRTLDEQLNYLIREGSKEKSIAKFALSYALYVYIKAFYTFYIDEKDNKEILNKLIHIEQTINSVLRKKESAKPQTGHPWEIIYKYVALLEVHNASDMSGASIEKAKRAVEGATQGEIVDLLTRYGELEYFEKCDISGVENPADTHRIMKIVSEIWTLAKNNPMLCKDWTVADGDVTYKRGQLRKMFTYMYH